MKTRARSTPAGNEIYVIANPGEGLTALASTNPVTALPKAVRDYDSLEFAVERRFSGSWYLVPPTCGAASRATTRVSRSRTRTAAPAPTSAALFDYPVMMFQDGGGPAFGPLATDRPHQFKTQFIYRFGFGTIGWA